MQHHVPGFVLAMTLLLTGGSPPATADEPILPRIIVADDGSHFIEAETGQRFRPWGVNYDHQQEFDAALLEDYWHEHWDVIVADFHKMRALGANAVRIHLQFGQFMATPTEPNQRNLDRLAKLLDLAEEVGLYVNLTGLGCYHKQDVPEWYDAMSEAERWEAQAAFWEAVAAVGAGRSAIFCYNLMNEPVVPGGDQPRDDWLGPGFADSGKHFVQFITLDRAGRDRPEIARAWINQLVQAIRKHDEDALITVGLVHWSLDRPGLTSGFVPERIADELDFIAVHLYPERDKVPDALETLAGFDVGKPIVIEETFPLRAGFEEMDAFLKQSRDTAEGWFSFFWGRSPEELTPPADLREAILRQWLEYFRDEAEAFRLP